MSFVAWIHRLADDLGLPHAGNSSSGVLELEFDGGMRCSIELSPDGRELFAASALAPLPASDAAEILEQLLIANGPALTAGPVFAIEPQRDEIVLQQSFAPQSDADYDRFVLAVGQFVQEARQWRDRLLFGNLSDESGADHAAESDDAPTPSTGFMRV